MADINVNNIVKSFEQDRRVLDGVSFQINPGARAAILGDNGAGKTTLFRIITGELAPDSGSVSIARGKRVGYVAQINTASTCDTVEDVLRKAYADVLSAQEELESLHSNMDAVSAARYDSVLTAYEARGGYAWEAELARVANGLNIGAEMRRKRFNTLSGGEQTRVCLARMIMENPDIMLLDEPTNHLDIESLEWLEDYLAHFKGTVLLISHDRYFLDNAVTEIIQLKKGKPDFYTGNYTYYARESEIRYQQQLMRYNREQAKARQLEFQIARLKAWGSVYDNPALHKKAAAMERRIERETKTERPEKTARMETGFSGEQSRASEVLCLRGVSKGFDGRNLFAPFDALVRGGGERIAVLGPNGAGKTTLLNIILGTLTPDTGSVKTGPSVKTAYLPQKVVFTHPERTLYDTMLYETGCSPQEANDRLGLFRFGGEDRMKTVSQLSGGEKARLKLCIIMMSRVNVLILDEPTNHLDLASREWIEEAVENFEGTLIFVSHDRYFIKRFANRVWEIDGGFTDYPSTDYDRYRRIKAQAARNKAVKPEPGPEPKEKPVNTEKSKVSGGRDPKIERRLNALERDIAGKEKTLAEFDARMEQFASDYIKLGELEQEKQALEKEIEEMYLAWEELAEQ